MIYFTQLSWKKKISMKYSLECWLQLIYQANTAPAKAEYCCGADFVALKINNVKLKKM